MKKLRLKYKKHLLTKSKFVIRNRRKRANKVYVPYIANLPKKLYIAEIIAPENFTLKFEDCEPVLKFIDDLKKLGNFEKNISINLSKVKNIGEGAISMLLSVMNELTKKNVYLRGEKPSEKLPKDILECSGFFKYMRGYVDEKNLNTKNIILRTGDDNTHQKIISPEINKAMETVWGVKARCPILFGGIGEMLRNSCDHAFLQDELITWHLGISHFDKENEIKLSFVDNGEGIISTYQRKGWIAKIIGHFSDNSEILESAFKNGIQSKTGLSWRGKGLPTIYEMYTDNIITNLVVITNNVYLDFDRGIMKTLTVSFSGTYYFWRIDNTCAKSYFPIN